MATSRFWAIQAGLAVFISSAVLASEPHFADLVHSLSWSSVHGECNGLVWHVEPRGRAARRLLRAGKPATEDLVRALIDPGRAVAAHLVLCRIWSREGECALHSTFRPRLSADTLAVGQQFDIDSIGSMELEVAAADQRSGELAWRSYTDGRQVADEATLQLNLRWWCDYFGDHGLRITTACTR